MNWHPEAEKILAKVPPFVRRMARMAVEKEARRKGLTEVDVATVLEVKEKYFSLDKERKAGEPPPTRIAVVRCETVSEVCPGIACFKAFNSRKLQFAGYGPNTEMVGFFTCGGCSGRRVARLVERLKEHGVDVIHLSSCMLMEGDYPRCPFVQQIKKTIEQKGIKVVEGTHH